MKIMLIRPCRRLPASLLAAGCLLAGWLTGWLAGWLGWLLAGGLAGWLKGRQILRTLAGEGKMSLRGG